MVRWIMFGAVSFEHMPEQLLSHQPEQKQNTEGPDHFLYDHSMMWLSSLSCGYSISSGHTYSTYSSQPHSCAVTFASDLSSGPLDGMKRVRPPYSPTLPVGSMYLYPFGYICRVQSYVSDLMLRNHELLH